MKTKEDIYATLKDILVDMFEVEETAISPEAHLYDELDIDSIDAVDLVVKLKDITGKKIQPEEFKNARTVQDVVEAVYQLIQQD